MLTSLTKRMERSRLSTVQWCSPRWAKPLTESGYFAPKHSTKFLRVLNQEPPPLDLVSVGSFLLRELGMLPEQSSEKVKQVLTRPKSRFWVKPADFDLGA